MSGVLSQLKKAAESLQEQDVEWALIGALAVRFTFNGVLLSTDFTNSMVR